MNVLVLTPDRVGSTLLQRLITVYMAAHDFDQPVINLHELTNGLMKYYSPLFNQEVLGKPQAPQPKVYYQSLDEITELLRSTQHYKTSRLAYYHIRNRNDTIADQLPFYQYLNDNFFIISARRENLLEHALSWCIYTHSKHLNVYSHADKINVFGNIYQNRINIDPDSMIKYLDQYVEYLAWVDRHFTVSSYFKYERDLPRIEQYILDLPIFGAQKHQTWQEIFGIEFQDWNQCHYLVSDLSGISSQLSNQPQLTYTVTELEQFQLQSLPQQQIPSSLSMLDREFLGRMGRRYEHARKAIDQLVQDKILVTPVPIKLQTMLEKRLIIKNFDQCAEIYNKWVAATGIGTPYTPTELLENMQSEIKTWHQQPLLK